MEGCLSFFALLIAFAAGVGFLAQRGRLALLERRVAELEAARPIPALTPPVAATVTTAPPLAEPPSVEVAEPPPPLVEEIPTPAPPAPVEPPVFEQPAAPQTSLEEVVGTQVFLKAGIAIVVLGMVLFLGYALTTVGPLGRVAAGAAVGAALLGGGLVAERREKYRGFGRALVAGGWSVLYLVAFAAHFLPAAKVIDSRLVASLLLLAVATAAVAFSLRYRSEWTTTATFLLIFLALTVAAFELEPTFNLAAATIVAIAIAILAWRLEWSRLLGLGVPATWLTLAVALVPRAMELRYEPGGTDGAVLAGLALAWAVYQVALLFGSSEEEGWAGLAYLSNLAGAFSLAAVYLHATVPGRGWLLALVTAVLYGASGWHLRRRERQALFQLSGAATLAAAALAVPLYLGLASVWVPIVWLLLFETALAAAIQMRVGLFRLLAYAGFAVAFIKALVPEATEELLGDDSRPALLAACAAVALLNAALLRGPWRPVLAEGEAPFAAGFFSTAASVFTVVLLWGELPRAWSAPALALAALLWIWVARRFRLPDFLFQGAGLLLVTAAAVGWRSWWIVGETAGWSTRSLSVVGALLALYPAQLLLEKHDDWRAPQLLAPVFLLVPTVVLAALVEGDALAADRLLLVAPVWAVLAGLYLEIGVRRDARSWWVVGHLWLLAATLHLHVTNFADTLSTSQLVWTVGMVVALLAYASGRRLEREEAGVDKAVRGLYLVAAAATIARLLATLVSGTMLTVALGLEGLAAIVLGFLLRQRALRWIGLGLLSFCILKLFIYDLSDLEGLARIGSFIVLGVILIAVSWAYTRFRGKLEELL